MALTKDNIDAVSKLLIALAQRNDIIYNLHQTLGQGAVWRSPDGEARIELTESERQELEAFVAQYVQDSETICQKLRTYLPHAV